MVETQSFQESIASINDYVNTTPILNLISRHLHQRFVVATECVMDTVAAVLREDGDGCGLCPLIETNARNLFWIITMYAVVMQIKAR